MCLPRYRAAALAFVNCKSPTVQTNVDSFEGSGAFKEMAKPVLAAFAAIEAFKRSVEPVKPINVAGGPMKTDHRRGGRVTATCTPRDVPLHSLNREELLVSSKV